MFKTEDEFDKTIRKVWGKIVVLDGITDIKEYNKKGNTKILWILNEPDKSSPNEKWNHRRFHNNLKEVINYSYWKSTYKRIMLVTDMIINGLNEIPDIDYLVNVQKENPLKKVAIININKNGGSSVSQKKALEKHYQDKKDILLEQIKGINPTIIIHCSMVNDFYDDLRDRYSSFEEKTYQDKNNHVIGYAYNTKKLLINYYHPNCRSKGMTDEWYCENILTIYNKWQELISKLSY